MIPLSGLLPEMSAAARFRISLAKTHNYISWSVFLTLTAPSHPPFLSSSLPTSAVHCRPERLELTTWEGFKATLLSFWTLK